MIRQKRIPTLLGIFFLLAAIFSGVYLVQSGQIFHLQASPEITPNQVKFTNLTDSSITLSWLTDKETSGAVNFGETTSLGETFADERDQTSGSTGSFQTHYVTLKNLKPKTTYYFKILSGGITFDDNGQPYEKTTASVISGPLPQSNSASGMILRQDGSPAEGAIVFLKLANTTPLSALVRSSGTWMISLNNAFSEDLSDYATYDKEAQTEEIFVQGGLMGVSTAITTTKNDEPVADITLGKTYDFRQNLPPEEKISPSPSPPPESESANNSKFSLGDLGTPQEATKTTQLSITNPEKNEKVATTKPEIIGTGPANQSLQITIESSTAYKATVKTDEQGNWSYTPPANLTPGIHTVTIAMGLEKISHSFTVLAAGDSSIPAFTATPSATISPSPTLTPTPSWRVTPTATASSRTSMPSTSSGVPTSGILTPTFFVLIMGSGLILSGFVLNRFLAHE